MLTPLRIVFVGSVGMDVGRSRSHQRYQALRDLGHDVRALNWEQPAPTLRQKLGHRVGLPADYTGVNRQLLEVAKAGPIDVLWLDKALSVWPLTVLGVRRARPDLRIGAWLEEYLEPGANRSVYWGWNMPMVDCAFTPRSQNLGTPWLRRHRPKSLVLVDETYDPTVHAPWTDEEGSPPPLVHDVTFIGTYERTRGEEMTFLARNGVRVSIWGSGWEHLKGRHPNLDIAGHGVFGRDYARTLCESRINLCFLRKANLDRQTNRTMEIPACGAFMLAERTPEHMRLFSEGQEAAFFSDRDEMLAQVRHYLAFEQERSAIARAGHARVTGGGFSHHDRMAYMLDVLCRPQASAGP